MKKILFILVILSLWVSAFCARVEVEPNRINISVNETYKLGYSVRPGNNHYTHQWYTEDRNVAIIDENGVVRGISPGYTKAYFELNNGTKAYSEVHVFENPNLYLNRYRINMNYHTTFELVASAGYKTNFYFESSNRAICDVDQNGHLIANYPGHCTITVSTDQGDVVHCFVYVYNARKSFL